MNMFTLSRNFDTLNHTALIQWVAESYPDIFLQAALQTMKSHWANTLPDMYRTSGPVSCIKHIRQHANLGLKEAKGIFDCLRGTISVEELTHSENMIYVQIKAAGIHSL